MPPRRKIDAQLKHRIATFSGLGKLTQHEIAGRVGLVETSAVALNIVSQQSVSKVCVPYRQKKMEDEQLFTLKDVKMMTGLKQDATILKLARREGLGTVFAKTRVYSKTDIDRLLELLSPPPGKLSTGEVERRFKVSRQTFQRWKKRLGLEPELRFGIAYYSAEQVQIIRDALDLGKQGLTVKKLARRTGLPYTTVLYWCKQKGWGGRIGLTFSPSSSRFLAQGEYGEALAFFAARAAGQPGGPRSADGP